MRRGIVGVCLWTLGSGFPNRRWNALPDALRCSEVLSGNLGSAHLQRFANSTCPIRTARFALPDSHCPIFMCFVCFRRFPVAATYSHSQSIVQQEFSKPARPKRN